MTLAAGEAPEDKARSGVRAWARKAGASLRTATPYGIVALLAASAVAPIAGVALGASGELAVVLAQLGGVGGNYLADTLLATARRLRGTDPTDDQWRAAIAEELLARLGAGDELATALRDEVAALLHSVGAVDVALREADERGREALAGAFGALGDDVGQLALLASDAAHVLATMQQQLAEQGRTQRQHTDLLRQSLVITAQLHQEVLGRRPERIDPSRERPDPDVANPYPGLASFQADDARYFHGRETLVAELLGRLAEQLVGGPPVVVIGVSGVGKSSLLRAGVLPAIANGGLAGDSAGWPWLVMTPGASPLAELSSRTATLAAADPAAVGALSDQAAPRPAAAEPVAAEPVAAEPVAADLVAVGALADPVAADLAAADLAVADLAAVGPLADPAAPGLTDVDPADVDPADLDPADVDPADLDPADLDPAAFGVLAARAGGAGRLILVVDQFEELFTQCPDPAERAAFVEALASAAPALVLIAVRADFYPQCTELAAMVPILAAGPILVGPLGTDELRRAVREPAADAGLQLEPGLEELLLTDLGALSGPAGYEPGALPLLAHALRSTWADREGTTMTVAGYRHTGGIRHAVAETAERSYLGLEPADRAALRSALLGLVTVVDNLTVRRPAARDETDVAVLRPLIDARLVTAGRDTVEITHEALLTSWPRLAGWLTEAREEILLRQRLAQAAADWSAAGEDPDLLYRGARLAAAREWAAGRTDVPGPQQRFLVAGGAAAEAELLAQRRGTRRLRRLAAGLAVALLLAVAGGLIALNRQDIAQRNGQEALSRQRAAESRTEFFTDELDAVRKALAAWAAAPTVEARGALFSAEQTGALGQLGTDQRAIAVAVSPDGRLVAVARADGRIQLWNSATLQRVGPEMWHPTKNLLSLRFAPDGRYLASGSVAVNGVVLWDVPSGRLVRRLPGFGAVAWLPDSSAVLASRLDGVPVARVVGAWDPDDGRLTGTITSAIRGALSMSVSPDAKYLALAGANGGQLLRRADQRSMATLPGAEDVVFAADDTVAVRTNSDAGGVVTRWDARTGTKIATLTGPADGRTGGRMAITPDGTVLVQGDDVRKIHALKLDGGGPRPLLTGFRGSANDLSLSADGHLLAVAGANSPPMLFRTGVDRLPHPQVVGYLTYDKTGARLATGSHDPVIRIWDPTTSNLTSTTKTRSTNGPLGIAYAPDGTIAAGSAEGTVEIFAPDGKSRGAVSVAKDQYVGRPVFSPDGSLLAVPVVVRPVTDPTAQDVDNRQDEPGLVDVLVWDTATLTPRARLETPGYESIAVTFTPDGSRLIAATNRGAVLAATGTVQDGAVWSWHTADMSLAARRNLPGVAVADVKVSPDGKYVALAAATRRVQLFTADRLEPAGAIARHPFELTRLAYSPDGRILATASGSDDDVVRLWDTRTTNLIAELRAQGNAVEALQFSPDGKTLATASGDWTVALWHLDPTDAVHRLCATAVPAARAENVPVPQLCR